MRLYELLKQISEILTPKDNSFFAYAIYTSDDDGGFLRTRHCWRTDNPVKDINLGNGYHKVMVTSKEKIDPRDFKYKRDTKVKMQITYVFTDATFKDASWDIQTGYRYVYIFDLDQKTYQMFDSEFTKQF